MGQNERTANYGTSVESCSDNSRSAPAVKLRISPSAAYNDRKGILPKNVDNFFEKMGVKKRLAMQTDTLLREENRTTVIKLDGDRRAQHQRR